MLGMVAPRDVVCVRYPDMLLVTTQHVRALVDDYEGEQRALGGGGLILPYICTEAVLRLY